MISTAVGMPPLPAHAGRSDGISDKALQRRCEQSKPQRAMVERNEELGTDAKVLVTDEWRITAKTKKERLRDLDYKAWRRFRKAATMNGCDGAARKRTRLVGDTPVYEQDIGDPDHVDFRCPISFYDIGAGFDPTTRPTAVGIASSRIRPVRQGGGRAKAASSG